MVCERWSVTTGGGREGGGGPGVQNQKQEPHTKLWGTNAKTLKFPGREIKLAFFLHFFFWSSRLPSLVFAAKIFHLLHFVAKISHSHCSSIFPVVS